MISKLEQGKSTIDIEKVAFTVFYATMAFVRDGQEMTFEDLIPEVSMLMDDMQAKCFDPLLIKCVYLNLLRDRRNPKAAKVSNESQLSTPQVPEKVPERVPEKESNL